MQQNLLPAKQSKRCTLAFVCMIPDTDIRSCQVLLMFTFFASTGEAVTQDGLDKRCEMWLERIFGLRLDFAIENSLPVCLEDGVIERDDQVLLFLACIQNCNNAL